MNSINQSHLHPLRYVSLLRYFCFFFRNLLSIPYIDVKYSVDNHPIKPHKSHFFSHSLVVHKSVLLSIHVVLRSYSPFDISFTCSSLGDTLTKFKKSLHASCHPSFPCVHHHLMLSLRITDRYISNHTSNIYTMMSLTLFSLVHIRTIKIYKHDNTIILLTQKQNFSLNSSEYTVCFISRILTLTLETTI